jgi:polysaccharide chain length determinant protein (PEP-CTERM system associated)
VPDTGEDGMSEITTPRTDLEERIVELEDTLDTLLLSYTDRHPDVVATRMRLEQLYERRQKDLTALREAGGEDMPVSDNPVVQELQIALNEADVAVQDLQAQVAAQRVRIADLQAKVDVIPEVEAELADLTRGYTQVKRTYDELLERLNQETLFSEKDEFEGSNFRIVQPPVASLEPVAPNRPRLFVAVTFGALLLAAGLAYLFHLMRPVFVDPRGLRQVTGLPVLGAVTMAWQSQHRTQRLLEASSVAVVAVMLVVTLVLVLVFQDAGVEAAAKIKRMALL